MFIPPIKAHRSTVSVDSDVPVIHIAKLVRKCIYYAIAVCLIISANSLWALFNDRITRLSVLIALLEVVLILILWSDCRISKRFLGGYLSWVTFSALCFTMVIVGNGLSHSGRWISVLLLFVMSPLLIHLLNLRGELQVFLRSFVNLVVLMSILSTCLWVLGPITRIIQPDCMILNTWVSGVTAPYLVPGYRHLLYLVQIADIGASVWRNTGIYPEAPMFSFVLSSAYILELCLVERPRRFVIAILVSVIVTSFSTAGLIVVIVGLVGDYYSHAHADGRGFNLRTLILILLIAAATIIGFQLLEAKLSSSSGSTRIDDYFAGYKAWIESPILGHGFNGYESIERYFSMFRGNNTGFSNSPMYLLAIGGIVLFSVYLLGITGLLLVDNDKQKLFGLQFVLIFATTIIATLPLCAIFISYGVAKLIELLSEEPAIKAL